MKRLRLPDSGNGKPEVVDWQSLQISKEWSELIAGLAPGTSPSEIQQICLRDHQMLESRRNLIASAPTNSGKSLIGYLFLLDAVRRGKRVVLLEPFRALAQEKYEELLDHRAEIEKFLGRKFTPKITTGDYALNEETLASPPPEEGELIVATPERIEVILRHPQYDGWIDGVGAVCVDEAHLISDPKRGGSLEFVIASFLSRQSPPRVMLLSATLGNTEKALRWLDPCDLVTSSLRWPPLRREILELDGEESPDVAISSLAQGILATEGTSLMVFVYRKADTVKLAAFLEQELGISVLPYHSNMSLARKESVRKAYTSGGCRCLVSTTALGTGINLPSTHLIIRDTTFFPEGKISPSQLHQMMGRAGRGEREGHSYVILRPKDGWNISEIEKALVDEPLPELSSGLLSSKAPKGSDRVREPAARLLLSLLCRGGENGFTKEELEKFTSSLLAGEELAPGLDEGLKWLSEPGVLLAYERKEDGVLFPTSLGRASALGGLPPSIAAAVGRLLRDLFSVDDDLSITSSLSGLDILLLAELVADRNFVGGQYSKALGDQVENWTERSPDKSKLFNQWIRSGEGSSQADELFGSLGISPGKNAAESARKQGYMRMRAAVILWMRGRGALWMDISRQWGVEGVNISEDEWIRNRSWLISGFAAILDIRCFYFHLREECEASDEKIAKAKKILRRLRAECFQVLGRLKYCSPLGPLLTRMKSAGTKGVGVVTIEKLESAGLTTPQAIVELSEERGRELGIDPKRLGVIRGYLRRR
jgi:helicase